jgi:hypothetical protein
VNKIEQCVDHKTLKKDIFNEISNRLKYGTVLSPCSSNWGLRGATEP